jgi:hypothetical protein
MYRSLVAEEPQVLHEHTFFTSSSVESYNSVAHAGALSAGSQLVSLCSEFAQCPSQSVRSHERSNNTLLQAVHFCYLCTVTLVQGQNAARNVDAVFSECTAGAPLRRSVAAAVTDSAQGLPSI